MEGWEEGGYGEEHGAKTALFLKCVLSGSLWKETLEIKGLIVGGSSYGPIAQRRDGED